jgi:hypothetical protein
MSVVLERNGASLVDLPTTLQDAGLRLCDAYAQERTRLSYWQVEKPYQLLTFVFRTTDQDRPFTQAVLDMFSSLAKCRYEHVTVSRGGKVDEPLLSIGARAFSSSAIALKRVEDAEASALGIAVWKSIPKREREEMARLQMARQLESAGFRVTTSGK